MGCFPGGAEPTPAPTSAAEPGRGDAGLSFANGDLDSAGTAGQGAKKGTVMLFVSLDVFLRGGAVPQ